LTDEIEFPDDADETAGVEDESPEREPDRTVVLVPIRSARSRRQVGEGVSLARSPQARVEEAVGLASAISLDVVAQLAVPLSTLRPATLFGTGKVEEIAALVKAEAAWLEASEALERA